MAVKNTHSPFKPQDDQALMTELWDPEIKNNPYNFALYAFPWGRPNTPLERHEGLRTWQADTLLEMADHIKANLDNDARGVPLEEAFKVFKSATASGRGVGKSALVGMITCWMMSCAVGSSTIITANTEPQLQSKTMPEINKWFTMAINSHWWDRTTLLIRPAPWYAGLLRKQMQLDPEYYYAQALLWNEDNPDAFAGQHNMRGTLLLMDEASGIPKNIETVAEGYFTDPCLHRYWFKFSNPRRNTGPFFECFHSQRKYWLNRQLDSRTVEGTDKQVLQEIIEKYGEDSDEARVEVKGMFPRQGDRQFINRELVDQARLRDIAHDPHAPLVMGVDIARYGTDKSIIAFRQGRDARSIPWVEMKGKDNMEVANEVAYWIRRANPEAVAIDAGNGTGVIDRLREMGYKVHEVWFGSKSADREWSEKRTELWAKMREWLRGGMIPDDHELQVDLTAPEYDFRGAEDIIKLESKEKLKKRGFASPDKGDALACTFAVRAARSDMRSSRRNAGRSAPIADGVDYDLFGG